MKTADLLRDAMVAESWYFSPQERAEARARLSRHVRVLAALLEKALQRTPTTTTTTRDSHPT